MSKEFYLFDKYIVIYCIICQSEYINAVKMNVADKNDILITTEHPQEHTIDKFWRLAFEKKSRHVVIIEQVNQSSKVAVY